MSRKKNVTRAVLWGIIYRFIVTILPFVTRTLLIRQLGMTYVGINGLFASVVGILSIAEMGFGSAMISKMYEPIAKKMMRRFARYYRYTKRYIMLSVFW